MRYFFIFSVGEDENVAKRRMKERVARKIVAGADETDGKLRVHAVHPPMSARENDQDLGHQELVPVHAHRILILGPSPPRGRIVARSRAPR
jgi:hypothetical protein